MYKLKQLLNKYVFYDVFVSWCAMRLLLLFKVYRDTKKVGKYRISAKDGTSLL